MDGPHRHHAQGNQPGTGQVLPCLTQEVSRTLELTFWLNNGCQGLEGGGNGALVSNEYTGFIFCKKKHFWTLCNNVNIPHAIALSAGRWLQ